MIILSRPAQRWAGVLGLLCVLALLYLSWIPGEMEVRTGAPPRLEHVAAYAGTGFLLKLGYPNKSVWLVSVLLAVLAGVLEIGQIWIPGRNSQFLDFVASAAGGALGLAVGAIVLTASAQRRAGGNSGRGGASAF